MELVDEGSVVAHGAAAARVLEQDGVRLVGDEVSFYNADDTLHAYFEKLDLFTFNMRKIETPLMPETARIEILSDGSESVLVQQDGRWTIGEGEHAERALAMQLGENAGLNNYFSLLDLIDIKAFHAYDRDGGLASYGLDKPLITARFVPIDGEPNNRAVGNMLRVGVPADPEDQTRFVTYGRATDSNPAVFTIDSKLALAFGQDATVFRDPRITTIPTTLIDSIDLAYPNDTPQQIVMKPGRTPKWHIGDQQSDLSVNRVAAALKRLADARAIDYVPAQLDDWQMQASLNLKPRLGREAESLVIYTDPQSSENETTLLVQRGKESVALRFPIESISGLLDPATLQAADDE